MELEGHPCHGETSSIILLSNQRTEPLKCAQNQIQSLWPCSFQIPCSLFPLARISSKRRLRCIAPVCNSSSKPHSFYVNFHTSYTNSPPFHQHSIYWVLGTMQRLLDVDTEIYRKSLLSMSSVLMEETGKLTITIQCGDCNNQFQKW